MKYFIALIQFVIVLSAFGQTNVAKKFLYKYHPSVSQPLPYRLFIPDNYSENGSYPLVLTLHGAGARGTDNEKQVMLLAKVWADPDFQSIHPAFIVSPQCPNEEYWTQNNSMTSLFEILDSLIAAYNIDTDRIYITGQSMGGFGTWLALAVRPEMFAAAIPVCGGANPGDLPLFSHIPLWNHHGSIDPSVPVTYSRNLMNEYENLGIPVARAGNSTSNESKQKYIDQNVDIIYSEYEGVTHQSWEIAYRDPYLLEWLFSKTKRTKNGVKIIDNGLYETISNEYELKFTSSSNELTHKLLLSYDLGNTWQKIAVDSVGAGSFILNTDSLHESLAAIFKLEQYSDEQITATDYSCIKRINKAGNSAPYYAIASVIYPNPATDIIHIKTLPSTTITNYRLINTSGRVVMQGILKDNFINVSELNRGMYCLNLSTGEKAINSTILIE